MTLLARQLAFYGAILCALSVLIGAFGSHGLESRLDQSAKATFEIGVRYQFYHSLALFALSYLQDRGVFVYRIALIMISGMILFSGSLYFYVLTGQHFLVYLTPLGGTLMLFSWVWLGRAIVYGTKVQP